MEDVIEYGIYLSPLWLMVLRFLAKTLAARRVLVITAAYAFVALILLLWLNHDCGQSGFIGFNRNCDLTPSWVVDWLEAPVVFGLLSLFLILPGVVVLALIIELVARWPQRAKATSPDSAKPLDRP